MPFNMLIVLLNLLFNWFLAAEPPVVRLTGSNDGNRVPRGDPVTLTCVPLEGLPLPTLELTGPSGGRLPLGATVRQQGNSSVLFIPSLTEDICIDCTGVNVAGSDTNTLCVNVQGTPPRSSFLE